MTLSKSLKIPMNLFPYLRNECRKVWLRGQLCTYLRQLSPRGTNYALPLQEGPRPGGLLPPWLSTSSAHPPGTFAPNHPTPIGSWHQSLFKSVCGALGRCGLWVLRGVRRSRAPSGVLNHRTGVQVRSQAQPSPHLPAPAEFSDAQASAPCRRHPRADS